MIKNIDIGSTQGLGELELKEVIIRSLHGRSSFETLKREGNFPQQLLFSLNSNLSIVGSAWKAAERGDPSPLAIPILIFCSFVCTERSNVYLLDLRWVYSVEEKVLFTDEEMAFKARDIQELADQQITPHNKQTLISSYLMT
ncbi:uncharacterized protein RSE6_00462 [Rhynchosporium secalis]|uniref:Uncharacterized protein n=1 Tax=Rhynchosporium secalis TaxID=38038 RepID=A0A1E1LX05_RHYSE|nr:uncharacterized protein RSE6_00462 [Rhynchosporium secalis]